MPTPVRQTKTTRSPTLTSRSKGGGILARAVDEAVRRLRAKIDDPYAVKLVHTIRGIGYVLEERST